jgi:hypothetical protein
MTVFPRGDARKYIVIPGPFVDKNHPKNRKIKKHRLMAVLLAKKQHLS